MFSVVECYAKTGQMKVPTFSSDKAPSVTIRTSNATPRVRTGTPCPPPQEGRAAVVAIEEAVESFRQEERAVQRLNPLAYHALVYGASTLHAARQRHSTNNHATRIGRRSGSIGANDPLGAIDDFFVLR